MAAVRYGDGRLLAPIKTKVAGSRHVTLRTACGFAMSFSPAVLRAGCATMHSDTALLPCYDRQALELFGCALLNTYRFDTKAVVPHTHAPSQTAVRKAIDLALALNARAHIFAYMDAYVLDFCPAMPVLVARCRMGPGIVPRMAMFWRRVMDGHRVPYNAAAYDLALRLAAPDFDALSYVHLVPLLRERQLDVPVTRPEALTLLRAHDAALVARICPLNKTITSNEMFFAPKGTYTMDASGAVVHVPSKTRVDGPLVPPVLAKTMPFRVLRHDDLSMLRMEREKLLSLLFWPMAEVLAFDATMLRMHI